jgi:Mg/Co/Ni transporter MgtE
LRAVAFRTPLAESIAVTSALALIVFSSICLGAILPLILKKLGVDPAHSSTTIQVSLFMTSADLQCLGWSSQLVHSL